MTVATARELRLQRAAAGAIMCRHRLNAPTAMAHDEHDDAMNTKENL
jgi:hypothetical protein